LVILYGIGDNYHPDHSEVPAALIRRLHEPKLGSAASVTVGVRPSSIGIS
jgi:GDP-L-fucose synthase